MEGVHEKGSFIFSQLWALGRQAAEENLKDDDPSFSVVGPSPIPRKSKGASVPRELTIPEIKEYVQLYATAARRAVHEAHFDGVEIHGANGYLVDQFLQDVSNQRQDEYGGSVENRSRFGLEVIRAVVNAVGSSRKVGIRLSPWSPFGGESSASVNVRGCAQPRNRTGSDRYGDGRPVTSVHSFCLDAKARISGVGLYPRY